MIPARRGMLKIRVLLFFFLLLLGKSPLLSQQPPPASEKAVRLYQKALALQETQVTQAVAFLREAVRISPLYRDAWSKLGDLEGALGNFEEALLAYEKALQIDPVSRQLVWFYAAVAAMNLERYELAADKLRAFLALNPKNERQQASAERLLRQAQFSAQAVRNPVPFSPQLLGPEINSLLPEYLPSLSADGLTLVFTRVLDNQEDFFFAQRESTDAPWQPALPLSSLNTPANEGAHCLSADGNTLVFTACNRPDGMGSCDLYLSFRSQGTWSPPQNMGSPINSAAYETQPTLSADGRTLIFTARRAEGLGNNDLWQSEKKPDGTWGRPQNLGPILNTAEDDQAPFLHPDGRTLYFMSKGHPGMGGFDLFVSRKNAQGAWGPPQNLGFPINSPSNEGALVVSADAQTAYFAKDQDGKPRPGIPLTDIWTFSLYEEVRPTPVTYARGTVVDAFTKKPLQATIEITDTRDSGSTYLLPVQADGTFLVCLPVGSDYAFSAQREGYLFFSEFFALSETREAANPYILEIALHPVPKDTSTATALETPVILRNIFFATGSAELQPASLPELQRLLQLLEENPHIHIQINGHTDDVGSESDNLLLSSRRAEAVYRFLLQQGIAAARLKYAGFGETQPILPNDSALNRSRNRRTEFIILK